MQELVQPEKTEYLGPPVSTRGYGAEKEEEGRKVQETETTHLTILPCLWGMS